MICGVGVCLRPTRQPFRRAARIFLFYPRERKREKIKNKKKKPTPTGLFFFFYGTGRIAATAAVPQGGGMSNPIEHCISDSAQKWVDDGCKRATNCRSLFSIDDGTFYVCKSGALQQEIHIDAAVLMKKRKRKNQFRSVSPRQSFLLFLSSSPAC